MLSEAGDKVATYSPIDKIHIANFRNLGNVEISFEDTPIVSLVGENESGKTSVVKAIAVCAMQAYYRNQKYFIRDGTDYFGVAIDLKDGTRLIRKKGKLENYYRIVYPDGKVWDYPKSDNTLPAPVQAIMGMTEEPETKEFLHIRTYEDLLLFVVTPPSANYKMMYSALKVDQITSAIKNGSTEVNELKSKIVASENGIATLNDSLKSIIDIDTTSLKNTKLRVQFEMQALDKLDQVMKLRQRIGEAKQKLGALNLINEYNLTRIDDGLYRNLESAYTIYARIQSLRDRNRIYEELRNIDIINIRTIKDMLSVLSRKHDIDIKQIQSEAYIELNKLYSIDTTSLNQMLKLLSIKRGLAEAKTRQEIYQSANGIEIIDKTRLTQINNMERIRELLSGVAIRKDYLRQYNDAINQITAIMVQMGVATSHCPNCGETVVFNMGEYIDRLQSDKIAGHDGGSHE